MIEIRFIACVLAVGGALVLPGAARASCRIHNDTNYSFTVESGNTSNQSVGSHTETSIAAGKIIGRSKEGKTVSGFCKDGDQLEIKDDHGVPILMPK
jgi:hypothetical protein